MSDDFAKKMSIQEWPPKKEVKQDKITEIKLVGTVMNYVKIYEQYSPLYFVHIALRSQIYRFPKARNIMDLGLDWSEYQNHDMDLEVIYQVTSLVQQMHEKRWILVDIVGKNIYVQEDNDFKVPTDTELSIILETFIRD